MMKCYVGGFALAVGLLVSGQAGAASITEGFTFAVANSGATATTGDHFHSNTGGSFGNPAGKAEVGRFYDEEVRGLSEYDLSGLSSSTTAFVTFNVFNAGGLFAGVNDFPFDGAITVEAYQGNNTEDLSDFQAATTATIGSFMTAGLTVGDVISFDIASVFNDAVGNGLTSLGIRLRVDPLNASGAWTFDQFRLTTDDQSTNPSPVPLPAALPLLASGMAVFGLMARRRKAARA